MQVRPPQQAVTHLREHLASVRTSTPDQWHVTLAFLGDVPAAEPLYDGLTAAAAGHEPFSLRLAGSGRFGPRATWVGVAGDIARLHSLARHVQDVCRAEGVSLEDRPYRPHLTVGGVDPRALSSYEGPAWRVSQLELVHSVLGKRALHTVLRAFPLSYQA
ncbi:MAG: 2,3-cyclic 3-phosphodiesterase [Actinomycetota bacterium]|nr:2,3-cyclic 3-phosphodiesterase [Actinomycetota bacterium]